MRRPSIARLVACARAALCRAKLRVVVNPNKGVVRIDAQSTIAIAAAVLIVGMVVPRDPNEASPAYTVPALESVIWLAL